MCDHNWIPYEFTPTHPQELDPTTKEVVGIWPGQVLGMTLSKVICSICYEVKPIKGWQVKEAP